MRKVIFFKPTVKIWHSMLLPLSFLMQICKLAGLYVVIPEFLGRLGDDGYFGTFLRGRVLQSFSVGRCTLHWPS